MCVRMKILSFQPYSLFSNGAGSRILRRLYQGRESQITGLGVLEELSSSPARGNIRETLVPAWPVQRSWMRWHLRTLGFWMRNRLFKPVTVKRIREAARKIEYDVLHVVCHGPYCATLCTDEFCRGKELWVSFHDHFATMPGSAHDAGLLWKRADRRLVVSEEMAAEYTRLFGPGAYELITDGVETAEMSQPAQQIGTPVTIYFFGLLHFEYIPLFKALANALDALARRGMAFKLLLRGTGRLGFLAGRSFETEYRPFTLNSADLKAELDAADILYFPVKFTPPEFYLYGLSTKMVGYLGAPGTILYHGPADAVACRLLKKWDAAVFCGSLDTRDLITCLQQLLGQGRPVSANAKALATAQFDLARIRARFWGER